MSFQSRLPFPDIERLIRASNRAFELNAKVGGMDGKDLIAAAIEAYGRKLTLVSSFGTEAAVLLHMASEVDRDLTITFVDTRRLFGETLRYRDDLAKRLGLTDVRSIQPDPKRLKALDPEDMLFTRDANMCCHVRKVEPLARALDGFDAWITGRKSYQSGTRTHLPAVEAQDGRVKFNPLARWTREDIVAYFDRHDLPRHPLESDGFLSIGCMPCTDRVQPGEDIRAGRWRGQDKTECGIHGA
ncbi:MAG: phosphoadenylyl-sulfate reductase [Pseudomonadota bacterium]|nr:phosphoadenylyl-sulfate reductase [Pseudomonadota bacterium]